MPVYKDWEFSVDPRPYVSDLGHQVEIVNSINGLDGEFSDGDIGGTGGGFAVGIIAAGLLILGYKYATKKGYI